MRERERRELGEQESEARERERAIARENEIGRKRGYAALLMRFN
jgi:hypothetical protein